MICPQCGNKLQKDAVFCTKCGAKLMESTPPNPKVMRKTTAVSSLKFMKKIPNNFIIGFIIVTVGLAVTTFLLRDQLFWNWEKEDYIAISKAAYLTSDNTYGEAIDALIQSPQYKVTQMRRDSVYVQISGRLIHTGEDFSALFVISPNKRAPIVMLLDGKLNGVNQYTGSQAQVFIRDMYETHIKGVVSNQAISNQQKSSPEPAEITYTFEEILVNSPTRFRDGGDKFTVTSKDTNYYGEITVGTRSYIDGTSEDIEGTYAVFVSEGTNVHLTATFREAGYSASYTDYGYNVDGAVEYHSRIISNTTYMRKENAGHEKTLIPGGLSYTLVKWSSYSEIFSEYTFGLLAVVISKNEAIRYAQYGTLPKALEGLTVTGLDEIFKKPN